MRVLLTGHQGYLGSVLAPRLLLDGHQVVGLDSGLFADCVLGPAPDDPINLVEDLRDVTVEQLTGFDAVLHFAALSQPLSHDPMPNDPLSYHPLSSPRSRITHEINVAASTRLAELAKRAGVARFVYASTCAVYGAQGAHALVDEDAALRPVCPQAEAKVRVEDTLWELADDDFGPTALRCATAFGFSPRQRTDVALNNLVGQAVLGGVVRVNSGGHAWWPLVHADDIAAAVLAVLAAPRGAVASRPFNVGTGQNNRTLADIARTVVDAVPGARLLGTGETTMRCPRVDFGRLPSAAPEFRPRWSIADGVEELVTAYRLHGMTRDDFDRRGSRLARLSQLHDRYDLTADLRPVASWAGRP
jgi:nucleoside-diphosphate-sugar epimerase